MAKLALTQAWNETAAFVKREAGLLFPVAFLLVALPTAIFSASIPRTTPPATPEAGPWIAVGIAAALIGAVGQLALSYLAVRRGATVGEALAQGLKRLLPLLGAVLLVGLVIGAIFFVAVLVAALAAGGVSSGPPAAPTRGTTAVLVLVLLPVMLYFGTRLLLMTPVAAVEPGGPLAILRRAWALTRGHFWKLLGFLVMIAVTISVINFAVSVVAGSLIILAGGPMEPGSISSFAALLVGAILQTVITVFLATLIARIYAQRAEDQPASGT